MLIDSTKKNKSKKVGHFVSYCPELYTAAAAYVTNVNPVVCQCSHVRRRRRGGGGRTGSKPRSKCVTDIVEFIPTDTTVCHLPFRSASKAMLQTVKISIGFCQYHVTYTINVDVELPRQQSTFLCFKCRNKTSICKYCDCWFLSLPPLYSSPSFPSSPSL